MSDSYISETDDSYTDSSSFDLDYNEILELQDRIGYVNVGLDANVYRYFPLQLICEETDDNCVICLTKYEINEFRLRLPCKHNYHRKCIIPWLEKSKYCPICKTEISID